MNATLHLSIKRNINLFTESPLRDLVLVLLNFLLFPRLPVSQFHMGLGMVHKHTRYCIYMTFMQTLNIILYQNDVCTCCASSLVGAKTRA